EQRFWRRSRAWRTTAARLVALRRSTGMSAAIRIIQPPTGTLKRAAFATHFISHGSREITGMSAFDWWLLTTTYGRRMSGGMEPVRVIVHAGLTRVVRPPIHRKSRPVV